MSKIINKLFFELENENITLEECKEGVLREVNKIEDELRDLESQLGDMEDLWQSRE